MRPARLRDAGPAVPHPAADLLLPRLPQQGRPRQGQGQESSGGSCIAGARPRPCPCICICSGRRAARRACRTGGQHLGRRRRALGRGRPAPPGTADALRRKLTAFLLEIEAGADPAAAFKELAARLPSYSQRIYGAGQEIRDKARWPDADQDERIRRRMRERIHLWDDDQAERHDHDDDVLEPDDQADEQQIVQIPPTAPTPARRRPEGSLKVPPEPFLRGLGRFDLVRNISVLVDRPGWDIAGWTKAPGLFYVRRAGRALAWAEHGLAGLPGWVVVVDGRLLTDAADRTRPKVVTTIDQAALLVRQALDQGLIDADRVPSRV
ncbi:hypothetical protein ACIQF6_36155 [Kitasatospora sp. NPDC092948]|uniref:hypothetical protein n=1 Tax=Kitasatospora sp. NPDC092948 TaxID=3364088 RepID=UPI003823745E